MVNLEVYRATESEQQRAGDLLRLLPKGRESVLDIGARDGHFSRLLTEHFGVVVALDLNQPEFNFPGVKTVAGDVTKLEYSDRSFDCVFCAEVLEHIPNLEDACREISRVARYDILIGVPFRQDTRFGRTTCRNCGRVCPPWGHVNHFDKRRLVALFKGWKLVEESYVGSWKTATNALSVALMDFAGNPWGAYNQDEPCIHCGKALKWPPAHRSVFSKCGSAAAYYLTAIQQYCSSPAPKWIHVHLSRG